MLLLVRERCASPIDFCCGLRGHYRQNVRGLLNRNSRAPYGRCFIAGLSDVTVCLPLILSDAVSGAAKP